MTPELLEEMKQDDLKEGGGPEFRKQYARMGADGWIGLSWSKELGGKELSHMEQYIFTDEVVRSGFAYPFLTTEAVAPVIAANANERFAKKSSAASRQGKVVIAIGYSEPNAGTDLASLTTKAERDGDDWIINGQKMWTSLANFADYVWLAARTDPDPEKKHKGLTMFLVPTDIEGFSHTPVHTLGVRTNATYYSDIRLPDKYRVGEVNGGWKLITGQLNIERLSLVTHGQVDALYQQVCEWAAQTPSPDGGTLHRAALGAAEPGEGAQRPGSGQADLLEAGLVHGPGRPGHGRCLGGQSLRQRILRRAVPPAAGGHGPGGHHSRRLTRRRTQGQDRISLAGGLHPYLWRRRQRGTAGHYCHGGAVDAPHTLGEPEHGF